jgi:ankyrin repeat protein
MKESAMVLAAKRTVAWAMMLSILATWMGKLDLTSWMGGPCANDRAVASAAQGDMAGLQDALLHGASADARDDVGVTALMCAANGGHVGVMRQLVEHGADVNRQDRSGHTALMHAARGDRVDAVRLLLKHGAEPNLRNHARETALDTARAWNAVATAECLVAETAESGASELRGESVSASSLCSTGEESPIHIETEPRTLP